MNLPNNIGEAVMQKRKFESRESDDFIWAIPLDIFLPVIVALIYAVIFLVSFL